MHCITGTGACNAIAYVDVRNFLACGNYCPGGAVAERAGLIETAAHRCHGRHQAVATKLAQDLTNQIRSRCRLLQQVLPGEVGRRALRARGNQRGGDAHEYATGQQLWDWNIGDSYFARSCILQNLFHAGCSPMQFTRENSKDTFAIETLDLFCTEHQQWPHRMHTL